MRRLILAPLLLLVACGDPIDPEAANAPIPPEPAPAALAPLPAPPAPAPVTSRAAAGFVGRWAVNPSLCAQGAFVLTPTGLTTAGKVACSFGQIDTTQDGWAVQASCTAEGPSAPANLLLRESGGVLNISGGPFEAVPLRRCPEPAAVAGATTGAATPPAAAAAPATPATPAAPAPAAARPAAPTR